MNDFQLHTERLHLTQMVEDDAENIYMLNANVEVMKYTGETSFINSEAARLFLIQYNDYQRNGFGRWAVRLKDSNQFLGWCGLKKHDDGMVDLGFRFMKEFWGKGYATEAAKECLNYGFNFLGITQIVGRIHQNNIKSKRVLEKLGMHYWKKDTCNNWTDALYYVITKKEYNNDKSI